MGNTLTRRISPNAARARAAAAAVATASALNVTIAEQDQDQYQQPYSANINDINNIDYPDEPDYRYIDTFEDIAERAMIIAEERVYQDIHVPYQIMTIDNTMVTSDLELLFMQILNDSIRNILTIRRTRLRAEPNIDVITLPPPPPKSTTPEVDETECPVCYNNITKYTLVRLNCRHSLCSHCTKRIIKTIGKTGPKFACPCCRCDVTNIEVTTNALKSVLVCSFLLYYCF